MTLYSIIPFFSFFLLPPGFTVGVPEHNNKSHKQHKQGHSALGKVGVPRVEQVMHVFALVAAFYPCLAPVDPRNLEVQTIRYLILGS